MQIWYVFVRAFFPQFYSIFTHFYSIFTQFSSFLLNFPQNLLILHNLPMLRYYSSFFQLFLQNVLIEYFSKRFYKTNPTKVFPVG
jgi:hypothetical protein